MYKEAGEASVLTLHLGGRISTKGVLSSVVHPKHTTASWKPNREALVQIWKHPMSTGSCFCNFTPRTVHCWSVSEHHGQYTSKEVSVLKIVSKLFRT